MSSMIEINSSSGVSCLKCEVKYCLKYKVKYCLKCEVKYGLGFCFGTHRTARTVHIEGEKWSDIESSKVVDDRT